jgi:hypothetical protein
VVSGAQEDERSRVDIYQRKGSYGLARPSRYPHCGFEKTYKNGTYKIKPERFFEQLKKDQEIEITVQQFICSRL